MYDCIQLKTGTILEKRTGSDAFKRALNIFN